MTLDEDFKIHLMIDSSRFDLTEKFQIFIAFVKFVKFENFFVFVFPRTFKFRIPPQSHESQTQHLGNNQNKRKSYFFPNFLQKIQRNNSEL